MLMRPSVAGAGCLVAALMCTPGLAAALPYNETISLLEDTTPLQAYDSDRSTQWEFRFQPLLDFDKDSCWNVPAIDPNGNLSPGIEPSSDTSRCQHIQHFFHSNAYVRGRCNRGWCAFIYAYYFQMDWAAGWPFSEWNHRHDWEHVIVWVKRNQIRAVAVSCHGDYTVRRAENVRWATNPIWFPPSGNMGVVPNDATHPKVVFHKDGLRTHCFRFAEQNDEPPEGPWQIWMRSWLIGYYGLPYHREKLQNHNFGSAHLAWKTDHDLAQNLIKSMPDDARNDGFDCGWDDPASFVGVPRDW